MNFQSIQRWECSIGTILSCHNYKSQQFISRSYSILFISRKQLVYRRIPLFEASGMIMFGHRSRWSDSPPAYNGSSSVPRSGALGRRREQRFPLVICFDWVVLVCGVRCRRWIDEILWKHHERWTKDNKRKSPLTISFTIFLRRFGCLYVMCRQPCCVCVS